MTIPMTELVVAINSGNSIVTLAGIARALGVAVEDLTVATDATGNATSASALIALSELSTFSRLVIAVPGVSGISTPTISADTEAAQRTFQNKLSDIISWVLSSDVSVQFTGGLDGLNGPLGINNYSGSHTGVSVPLAITNGAGVIDIINEESTITVTASGGISPKINGLSGPQIIRFTNGTAALTVSDSGAGIVHLAMSLPTHPSVVLATDAAIVTLS